MGQLTSVVSALMVTLTLEILAIPSIEIQDVSANLSPSGLEWRTFKEDTIDIISFLPGWCPAKKARVMMDLIKEHQFQLCVEVGVFGGSSLVPIAKALQFNGQGIVYGIDAWAPQIALRGLNPDIHKADYEWWAALNYEEFYVKTARALQANGLMPYCQLLRMSAEIAADFFEEESIDFIHLDGSHALGYSYQELQAFFPKVKMGGYILLNDACWPNLRESLLFLLENTEAITKVSPTLSYVLFHKTEQRLNEAKEAAISANFPSP